MGDDDGSDLWGTPTDQEEVPLSAPLPAPGTLPGISSAALVETEATPGLDVSSIIAGAANGYGTVANPEDTAASSDNPWGTPAAASTGTTVWDKIGKFLGGVGVASSAAGAPGSMSQGTVTSASGATGIAAAVKSNLVPILAILVIGVVAFALLFKRKK